MLFDYTNPSYYSITFIVNRAVCEIMWRNMVQPARPQTTIRRMRFACSIIKVTNAHSEFVTFIGFPLQQGLRRRTSMLRVRYTYTASLVNSQFLLGSFTVLICSADNKPNNAAASAPPKGTAAEA